MTLWKFVVSLISTIPENMQCVVFCVQGLPTPVFQVLFWFLDLQFFLDKPCMHHTFCWDVKWYSGFIFEHFRIFFRRDTTESYGNDDYGHDDPSGAGGREAGNAPVPAGAPLRLPTAGRRGVSVVGKAARAKGTARHGAPPEPRPLPRRGQRQRRRRQGQGAPRPLRCPLRRPPLRQLEEGVQPEGTANNSNALNHCGLDFITTHMLAMAWNCLCTYFPFRVP